MPSIDEIRRDFPVLERVAYLASASVAPMPVPALDAIRSYLERVYIHFDLEAIEENACGECRRSAAQLIGASPEEVALVKSTTEGVNLFAAGVPWEHGDKILLNEMEYPANVIPWYHQARLHGLKVEVVPSERGEVSLERLVEAIDQETKVVAVSHVEFANGFRHDLRGLAEAAHAKGALLFVDAIQSLGVIQVNVKGLGIDGLATGGYKWLCGPVGTGFAYIKRDLIKGIEPTYVGLESLDNGEEDELWERIVQGLPFVSDYRALADTAKRFEYGSMSSALFRSLAASLRYLQDLGSVWIETRIAHLTDYLFQRLEEEGHEVLTPRDWEKRAGIVLFQPGIGLKDKQTREEFVKRLIGAGVYVNIRSGGVRVSCHFFNTEEDLERLLEAVVSLGQP